MGMDPANVYIGDIGDVLEINHEYMKKLTSVPAGRILVDGLGVGDVGSIVLRDRKHLAEDGLIVVVCTIDDNGRSWPARMWSPADLSMCVRRSR